MFCNRRLNQFILGYYQHKNSAQKVYSINIYQSPNKKQVIFTVTVISKEGSRYFPKKWKQNSNTFPGLHPITKNLHFKNHVSPTQIT